jgi:chromosome segregation ATPase
LVTELNTLFDKLLYCRVKRVVVINRLEEARRSLAEARDKIDRQNQQLSDYEAEVNLLRRRVEQLENDRDKDKKLIAQLQETLNRTRAVSVSDPL